MFEFLNNFWILLICCIILYIIITKIIQINKPFNTLKYIEQYKNRKKLEKKLNFNYLKKEFPTIAEYYLGIN
jgi:hypothetical protein